MKKKYLLFVITTLLLAQTVFAKDVEDFNFDWLFHLGDVESAQYNRYNDSAWQHVRLPHDWAVALPYSKDKGAASTGFKAGGIGWYRKTFELDTKDINKAVWLEFDGIYNNAQIWINGHFAYERPYGYASFSVPINQHAKPGKNVIAVRVDRTAYIDSRWYTGSGIYRSVRLIKANPIHIPQWGVQVLTPIVSEQKAEVQITTDINVPANIKNKVYMDVAIINEKGEVVAKQKQKVDKNKKRIVSRLALLNPSLWSLDSPSLYTAKVTLRSKRLEYDIHEATFGIRISRFDANTGYFLNGKPIKIKGVNLHHDAGAVGTAVPKEIWRYRLEKLASIGVNAIRLSHNPHTTELIDLCDEMGFLVISEAFDDWERPKKKSLVWLSDNAGKGADVAAYNQHFNEWSERDIKDLVRRDFNHPSIILWSIGNEIEWTYPYYKKSLVYAEGVKKDYKNRPIWDRKRVLESFTRERKLAEGNLDQADKLVQTAQRLTEYVKEIDTSRPVTAGLVIPSVGFASGYTDALDVVGFNYRAVEYDIAHKTYPDKPIYGSENWGSWPEWKAALERDFVPGIFVWTGFAYKGEAGPWPRKGLEISFFDFAGHKTPRGHQFESFWVDQAKVYLATIPAEKSEYQFDKDKGWVFTERTYPIPKMKWLRPWEWYGVEEKWHYKKGQNIVVQVYSNTQQSELFLNGTSLGRQALSDDNNRILLWQVPYHAGELKVVGYNEGKAAASYALNTYSELSTMELTSSKVALAADGYDVTHLHVTLLDSKGHTVLSPHHKLEFDVEGPAKLLAVDNGWEKSVQPELATSIISHNGRALGVLQSTQTKGTIRITVKVEGGPSKTITLTSN